MVLIVDRQGTGSGEDTGSRDPERGRPETPDASGPAPSRFHGTPAKWAAFVVVCLLGVALVAAVGIAALRRRSANN
jgi:hypothetical protein